MYTIQFINSKYVKHNQCFYCLHYKKKERKNTHNDTEHDSSHCH